MRTHACMSRMCMCVHTPEHGDRVRNSEEVDCSRFFVVQGGKGSSDKPCPTKPSRTGVDAEADHHCAHAFGLASGPPLTLE